MGTNIRLGIGIPNRHSGDSEPSISAVVTIIVLGLLHTGKHFPCMNAKIKITNTITGKSIYGITNDKGRFIGKFKEGSWSISSNDPVFALSGPQSKFTVVDETPQEKSPDYSPLQQSALTVQNWFGAPYLDGGLITSYIMKDVLVNDVNISIPILRDSSQLLSIHASNDFWESYSKEIFIESDGVIVYENGESFATLNATNVDRVQMQFSHMSGKPMEKGKIVLYNKKFPDWSYTLDLPDGTGEIKIPSDNMEYNWEFFDEGTHLLTGSFFMNKAPVEIIKEVDDVTKNFMYLTGVEGESFAFSYEYSPGYIFSPSVDWGDGTVESFSPEGNLHHEYTDAGSHDITIKDAGSLSTLDINNNESAIIENVEIVEFSLLKALHIKRFNSPSINTSSLTDLETLSLSKTKLDVLDISSNLKLTECSIIESYLLTFPDFSKQLKLETVRIQKSLIIEIDLTEANLPYVEFLDISSNSKLEEVYLNNIKGINQFLVIYDLNLKTLDIDYCSPKYLSGIENCTELVTLNIKARTLSPSITTLDLSKLLKLKYLDLNSLNDLEGLIMNPSMVMQGVTLESLPALINFITNFPKTIYFSVLKDLPIANLNWTGNNLSWIHILDCKELIQADVSNNKMLKFKSSGCSKLTTFKCRDNQLKSLTEEDLNLPELSEFDCFGNKLTTLDLSKSPRLTLLTCAYNQLTTLVTSLNTAGLSELTTLNCYNNQLTSLDLSTNPNLVVCNCSTNKLTSLNLTGCTSLFHLFCYANLLTSLSTVYCTSLSELDCSNNQITDLKTPNTSITGSLKRLKCSNNSLTSLYWVQSNSLEVIDFSNNTVRELAPFMGFLNLKEIIFSNNKIAGGSALDKCGNLWKIIGDNNLIESFNASPHPKLVEVNVSGNQISTMNLLWCKDLKKLNVNQNTLTYMYMHENLKLEELFCNGNPLATLDLLANVALKNLTCKNSQLSVLDVTKNVALTYLDCSENSKLKAINVSQNPELTYLNVAWTSVENLLVTANLKLNYIGAEQSTWILYGGQSVALCNSLPMRTPTAKGNLVVYDTTYFSEMQPICDAKNWNLS